MENDNSNVLGSLLTGGLDPRSLAVINGLLQSSSNPQQANAALGPATTNVLNNASTATGNPNMAAGIIAHTLEDVQHIFHRINFHSIIPVIYIPLKNELAELYN